MATPVTVPMVGKIVSVSVKVGDKVEENDQVAVLEAMKMEMPVVAPVSGVVKEIFVKAGQEVEAEAPIVDHRDRRGQRADSVLAEYDLRSITHQAADVIDIIQSCFFHQNSTQF